MRVCCLIKATRTNVLPGSYQRAAGLAMKSVTHPDEVQRNKKDRHMAIFYRQHGDKSSRTAVLMQETADELQHSVMSSRFARRGEREAGAPRRVWAAGE